MKRSRKRVVFALIACHFGLMALGMTKVEVPQNHWAVKAARWYSELTGAGVGFGFFSPNIPRQVFIDFDVTMEDGQVQHPTLQDTAVSDVRLRLGNMIRLMTKSYREKKIYRSLAASLTATMYQRYPTAKAIRIRTSLYDFPTMQGFRNGERPKRVEIYSATFHRGGA